MIARMTENDEPCRHGGTCICIDRQFVSDCLTRTLAGMRKDGQGLSQDQELTIRRGFGL